MAARVEQEKRPAAGRPSQVRLSELMAALSLSSDLALGQPMEHVLRSCLIALRLAEGLGLDEAGRAETYWVTLLATVCTGESFELVQMFGDDIAFRSGMYHVGPSQLAQLFYLIGRAAGSAPFWAGCGGRVRLDKWRPGRRCRDGSRREGSLRV